MNCRQTRTLMLFALTQAALSLSAAEPPSAARDAASRDGDPARLDAAGFHAGHADTGVGAAEKRVAEDPPEIARVAARRSGPATDGVLRQPRRFGDRTADAGTRAGRAAGFCRGRNPAGDGRFGAGYRARQRSAVEAAVPACLRTAPSSPPANRWWHAGGRFVFDQHQHPGPAGSTRKCSPTRSRTGSVIYRPGASLNMLEMDGIYGACGRCWKRETASCGTRTCRTTAGGCCSPGRSRTASDDFHLYEMDAGQRAVRQLTDGPGCRRLRRRLPARRQHPVQLHALLPDGRLQLGRGQQPVPDGRRRPLHAAASASTRSTRSSPR